MKPSAGLVAHPVGFAEPVFGNSVVGQMARSVDDVRLLLGALAGPDARDPLCPDPYPPLDWHADVETRRLRIAFSPDLGLGVPVDATVARCVARAVEALRDRGHRVDQQDPAWPEGAGESGLMPLQLAGLAALYADELRADPSRFDPDIVRQIEAGLATTGAQVAAALHLRERLFAVLAGFFERFDALVTPTTPCTAWPLPDLGPSHIDGIPVDARAHAVFTPIFNHTYLPACSVPCGIAENGLPVGLQVVGGRRFRDAQVLAIARQVEAATEHDFSVPRLPG
jgi:aspartyl-tRNA(Asn)/glutamyl-tRNA(Gln) amidotransferase subunit A